MLSHFSDPFLHFISPFMNALRQDLYIAPKPNPPHNQVTEVVKKTESLRKISFLAHSLGGLIARYAIAVLYSADGLKFQSLSSSNKGLIAGLEAINFITLATPHLGVRGNKQV